MKHLTFDMSTLYTLRHRPTSLARRLLLLCLMVMGAGNSFATEVEIATDKTPSAAWSSYFVISSTEFSSATDGMALRVYVIEKASDKYIYISNPANWVAVWGGATDLYESNTTYYHSEGYFEFPIGSTELTILKNNGLNIESKSAGIQKITLATATVAPSFLGELKSGGLVETKPTKLAKDTDKSTGDVTVDGTGYKYARIYLADTSDEAVAVPSGATFTVTGGTAVPSGITDHELYGYYLYNAGGLGSITTKLTFNDATVDQYHIIAVLSTDAPDNIGTDNMTEPDWDKQVVNSFRYPLKQTKISKTIDWNPNGMTLNTGISNLADALATDWPTLSTGYYVNWYVSGGSGSMAKLQKGTAAQSGCWTIDFGDKNSSFVAVGTQGFYINSSILSDIQSNAAAWLNTVKIYPPTDVTYADVKAANNTFSCRIADVEASSGFGSNYIYRYGFTINDRGFDGKEKSGFASSEARKVFTLEEKTSVTSYDVPVSIALDGTKTFARFYLLQNGTAVDPVGKLSVTGGTAYSDATRGYYIYNNGSAVTIPSTVRLTVDAGTFNQYQVVCNVSKDVVKSPLNTDYEPDLDYRYTYSFGYVSTWDGDERSAEVRNVSIIVDNEGSTATADLSATAYKDYIKSKFVSNWMTDFYLRWYLQDADGNQIELASDPFTGNITTFKGAQYTDKKGWSWISKKSWNENGESGYVDYSDDGNHNVSAYFGRTWWNSWNSTIGGDWTSNDWSKTFKVTVTRPSTIAKWENCKIVCVMTNNTDELELDGDDITAEPPFQLKYVFNVVVKDDLQTTFTKGDDTTAEVVTHTIIHDDTKAYVDLNDYFNEIEAKVGAIDREKFYLRWYLTKNGTPVENLATYATGGQLLSLEPTYDSSSPNLFINKKEGKVFYGNTVLHGGDYITSTATDKQGAKQLVFTKPDGTWDDWRIVCVMSNDAASGGIEAGNFGGNDYVLTEPTIQLKYVFKMMTQTEADNMLTLSPDVSSAIGKAYQGTLLVDKDATTITVNIADTSVFHDWSTTHAVGDDNMSDQFVYARFFLTDSNGNVINASGNGYTLSLTNSLPAGVYQKNVGSDGLAVYAPVSGFTSGLLSVKVAHDTPVDWTAVRVACVIATDSEGFDLAYGNKQTSSHYYESSGKRTTLIAEPAVFHSAWLCRLITDKDDFFTEAEKPTKERTLYQLYKNNDKTSTSFTVDLEKYFSLVQQDFGSTTTPFYMRWYVVDKSSGDYLRNGSGQVISADGVIANVTGGHAQRYGMIWYSNTAAPAAAQLKPAITLPSGFKQEDVQVVCLMTNDLAGVNTPDHSGDGLSVSSDPTNLKWKYTFKFINEADAPTIPFTTTTATPAGIYTKRKTMLFTHTDFGTEATKTAGQFKTYLEALYTEATAAGNALSGKSPQYMRIYLTDGDGTPVTTPLSSFTKGSSAPTFQQKRGAGLVWAGTPFSPEAELDFEKFTRQAARSWNDVCVVVDLTDNTAGMVKLSDGTTDSDIITQDPNNIAARLVLKFKETKDAFSNPERGESFLQTVAHEHFSTETVSLDLGGSSQLDAVKKVFTDNSKTFGGTDFYIRWYIADQDGDRIIPMPDGIALQPVSDQYRSVVVNETDNIGVVWYGGYGGAAYSADLLKMNVKVAANSEGKTPNLNEYRLMCVMTSYAKDENYYNAATDEFTLEPALQVNYMYRFESEFEGYVVDGARRHEYTIVVGDGKTEAEVTLNRYMQQIAAEYGTNAADLVNEMHMRWYVTKKGTTVANSETLLTPVTEQLSTVINKNHKKTPAGHGLYWNSETNYDQYGNHNDPLNNTDVWSSDNARRLFNVNFTKPSDNWEDFTVEVVMSNDLTAEGGQVVVYDDPEMTETQTRHLAHEPNHLTAHYTFRFVEAKNQRFTHSRGFSGRPYIEFEGEHSPAARLDDDGLAATTGVRQSVHTYEYDLYVNAEGVVLLEAPLDKLYNGGSPLEPTEYWRWYNFNTDFCPAGSKTAEGQLVPYVNPNTVIDQYFRGEHSGDPNLYRGWFAWRINETSGGWTNATCNNVAVMKYTAPKDEYWRKKGDGSWPQVDIACDVSRYNDGIDLTTKQLIHEPTLSVRYLYHIHPAQALAEQIKAAAPGKNDAGYVAMANGGFRTLEDEGYCGVGLKDNAGTANVHLNLQQVDDYWFYDFQEDRNGSLDGIWNTSALYQAQYVTWRAYTSDLQYYSEWTNAALPYDKWNQDIASRFLSLNFDGGTGDGVASLGGGGGGVNNSNYLPVGGSTKTAKSFKSGDHIVLIGYVSDGTHRAPVTRYELILLNNQYPILYSDLPVKRTLNYMENHYTNVATITFDDYEQSTLTYPTTPRNNMTPMPAPWGKAYYGFCYPELHDFSQPFNYSGITPIHGEYGLFKTKGIDDLSETGDNTRDGVSATYHWYEDSQLHDRTYELTDGRQTGYFFYVDASDEARQIADVTFEGEMCQGSTIVLTAAVANVTSGPTAPQLAFELYGIMEDEKGEIVEKRHIQTFFTSDFPSVGAGAVGRWYQVHGHSIIPVKAVENYSKFMIMLNNYAADTEGADYCVDDIRIYVKNAKIIVEQAGASCNDEPVSTTFKIPFSTMSAAFSSGSSQLFYRICKADGTVVPHGAAGEKDHIYYNNGDLDYGVKTFDGVYDVAKADYEDDDNDNPYYIILRQALSLTAGQDYFLSVAMPKSDGQGGWVPDENTWGTPQSICSFYSDIFMPMKQYIELKINGTKGDHLPITCGSNQETVNIGGVLRIPDPETGIFLEADDLSYDWYVRVRGEATAENGGKGTLAGSNVKTFNYNFAVGKTYVITAEPKQSSVTIGGRVYTICPQELLVELEARHNGPELYLGFPEVLYPAELGGGASSLRIGLKQLHDIQNGTPLHIPVHHYLDMNKTTVNSLIIDETEGFVVLSSNDPTWASLKDKQIGTVADAYISTVSPFVPLAIRKSTAGTDITFHEGYEYELTFRYYDEADPHPAADRCYGEAFLTLKVVPEYVTWTGAVSNNTNWNNDGNWTRSTRNELYKRGSDGLGANSDDYENNGEGTLGALQGSGANGDRSQLQTYVPMKFTKVTIPLLADNLQSPYLASLVRNVHSGIYNFTYNGDLSAATPLIEYDMMAKVDQEYCTHLTSTKKVYECEKFYGNTCQQIYFKPGGRLRYQHYLTYNRAWVDIELKANRWCLLTSPLMGVVAGDMYVPAANGRQETEAFQEIRFNTADDYNSRTRYPIYQRSWDKATSPVYTEDDDIRQAATRYFEGNIGYATYVPAAADDGSVKTVLGQWSHTYNDVDVPYFAMTGFSIRPHKQDQEKMTLIRLPKSDDEQYRYYRWDDTTDDYHGTAKSSEMMYRLMTHYTPTGILTMNKQYWGNDTGDNRYLLVGNPFMGALNTERLFAVNDFFEPKYWQYENGVMVAHDMADMKWVEPMQAFFVKVKDGVDLDKLIIECRPDMQIGRQAVQAVSPSPARSTTDSGSLSLTAGDGRQHDSRAVIVIDSDATDDFVDDEDVETLFDTNNADMPVIFTLAGRQAVSIDRRPSLDLLSFGVSSSGNEPVTVTLTAPDAVGTPLYVHDVVDNTCRPVGDGSSFTVVPNDYGRYYLATFAATAQQTETQRSLVVSVRQRTVTLTAPTDMHQVRVLSASGAVVGHRSDPGRTCCFTLRQGTYLIEADGEVRKILVR